MSLHATLASRPQAHPCQRVIATRLSICILALVLIACPGDSPAAGGLQPQAGPAVALSAAAVETGGTLLIQIDCRRMPSPIRDLQVSLQEQRIRLFQHPARDRGVYIGLIGVPLTAPAGQAVVSISWTSGTRQLTRTEIFEIMPGEYGEERLKVDPRHVRPSPKELERITREQEELKRVYASGGQSPLWQGGFRLPVPGELNGPFGTRRVFNGELKSHHTGVDFRAQTGDPVCAANSGVVRLAKDLFYSGNAVILDHGAGVFTSYSHLSRIDIKLGQKIHKGQVLGLAGATGRATGPHLHWGVKVNSVNVDPLAFIRLLAVLGSD
jgi:Peptidase family M23